MNNRDVLLWLDSLFLSEKFLNSIMEKFSSLDELFSLSETELMAIPNSNEHNVKKILASKDKDYFNELIENINKYCTDVMTIYDENYPEVLCGIENPPKVIYARGNPLNLNEPCIGVVGARKCTDYGKWACAQIVRELSNLGITVVSGLAAGIDSIAHRTSLENGNYTIGVLGNGLDIVFPRRNERLYQEMFVHGTVISEYPIGAEAIARNFPRRNRIISGLSLGVIVVEAEERSGSLITARLAAEQGREVFALPGNINSLYSVGTNRLIRDGATPYLDIDDVLIGISKLKDYTSSEKELDGLEPFEMEVLNLVKSGVNSVDQIVEVTGKSVAEVSGTVTILELKECLETMSGIIFPRV